MVGFFEGQRLFKENKKKFRRADYLLFMLSAVLVLTGLMFLVLMPIAAILFVPLFNQFTFINISLFVVVIVLDHMWTVYMLRKYEIID